MAHRMTEYGLATLLALVMALAPIPSFAGEAPHVERMFARGVYWPWEHTAPQAKAAGMEEWAFVDHMMGVIRNEMNCNLIWFTNGPSDPKRVCELAEKHGLTVLVNTKLNSLFYGGVNYDAIPRLIEETTSLLQGESSLGAYVLKDEPRAIEAQQMESYRRAFEAADPTRPSIVVSMTGDTEKYVKTTGFPIICTDIYHFGGTGSPNIPNPSRRSQRAYSTTLGALTTMTADVGKTAWVMPGAFANPWGASWLDDDGNVVIEPGAYWHWRMPTPAEMQWQVWESVRSGVRGVVFYTILTCTYYERTPERQEKQAAQAASAKKSGFPLTEQQIHTGAPCCLTSPGGKMNAQSRAMGAAFGQLAQLESLLTTFEPSRLPAVFAGDPVSVASFESPTERNARFAVAVNDDVETSREATLLFPPNTREVVDLVSGKPLDLSPASQRTDGLREAALYLEAGAGAVLRVRFQEDRPGWFLFEENFGQQVLTVKLENASRRPERRGFNMGRDWVVRKDSGADDVGQILIDGLTKQKAGPLGGSLRDVKKGDAAVYLQIDGAAPRAESIVVQFVDAEGKAGWNKSDNYHLPVPVPAETESIRIRLADDASVKAIRMWRVPTTDAKP